MYSKLVRIIIIIVSLTPILVSLWIVNIVKNYKKISFYLDISSGERILAGLSNIFITHYLLFFFLLSIGLSKWILKSSINTLTRRPILIKSIKPADINITSIMIGILMPLLKFFPFFTGSIDLLYLTGYGLIILVYIIIGQRTYHYNLFFALFNGYRNFEIQTKNEVTYLMLSKQKAINPTYIKSYVQLTDYMIINVSST